ncbi:MAG: hypothetical protein ACLPHI_07490 [Terriglobales bacterium]|jgi:hypothetical protein
MDKIPWRVQLGFVAACYAAVLAFAAVAITVRHMLALRNPGDFNGGMAAAGDWMLEIFIGGLLLIPTFLLAFVIRKREAIYTAFSKVLFGFSLTAPISLGLILVPAISQSDTVLGNFCMYRLFGAPMVMTWLGVSRLLARFKPAKRWTSSALLVEAGNIALVVALLFFSGRAHRG